MVNFDCKPSTTNQPRKLFFIRAAVSPAMFKKLLKTHFLTQHFPPASFQPADF